MPDVLNASLAHALGRVVVEVLGANNVVLGRNAPLSRTLLRDALANGLRQAGANITDIGLCGTEGIYYAAAYHAARLTPADENGFTLACGEAIPVSEDFSLFDLLIIGF